MKRAGALNTPSFFSLFILHPSAFILSSSVREETSECKDPQPYEEFHQCR